MKKNIKDWMSILCLGIGVIFLILGDIETTILYNTLAIVIRMD